MKALSGVILCGTVCLWGLGVMGVWGRGRSHFRLEIGKMEVLQERKLGCKCCGEACQLGERSGLVHSEAGYSADAHRGECIWRRGWAGSPGTASHGLSALVTHFPFSGDRLHSLPAVPRVLTLDPLL